MIEARPAGGSRRATFGVLVGVACVVAFFWVTRMFLSGTLRGFSGVDDYLLFYPAYEVGYQWIARGILPLWNPYTLCGIPWIAALQEGFLYPPHVLYLLFETPTAFATSTVLHLMLVAVSTVLFARRAGLGYVAAILGAVLYVLRGVVPNFAASEPPQFEALAWLPVGACAIVDLARGGGRRAVALLAFATAFSILAGYPQITAYVLYTWGTLFVALLIGRRPGLRDGAVTAGLFAAAIALGILGGGAQLFPSAELLHLGTRGSQRITVDTMFPVGGWRLGNPAIAFMYASVWGTRDSFGLVGLGLLVAAPFVARRRSVGLWAVVWCVVTVLFAIGPVTPFFQVYLSLPTLGWFRAPNRIMCVADFAFAVAAAVGLDGLLTANGAERPPGRSGRLRPSAAFIAVLLGVVTAVSLGLAGLGIKAENWPAAVVVATAVVALVVVGWAYPTGRPLLGMALVALATIEIFQTAPQTEELPYTESAVKVYHEHDRAFRLLGYVARSQRVWVFNSNNANLTQKRLALYGIRSFDDYEPVNLLRQSQYYTYLVDATPTVSHWPWLFAGNIVRLKPEGRVPPLAARRHLLDLAAVEFVVFPRIALMAPEIDTFVRTSGLREWRLPFAPRSNAPFQLPGEAITPGGKELMVYENPFVLPRAYVTYRALPAPEVSELLGIISQDRFDPLAESYVEGDPGFVADPGAPARGTAAQITRDEERIVEVTASLRAPGLLVLADSFYPGWRATVDNVPAPIVATNHLFRGVPVPAGRHQIRFEYRPWSFTVGAGASLATLVVLVGLVVPRRRKASTALDAARTQPGEPVPSAVGGSSG